MSDAPTPYRLMGFVDPMGQSLGFMIPVFEGGGKNAPLVQEINAKGLVQNFSSLGLDEPRVQDLPLEPARIGGPEFFVFGFGKGDIIAGCDDAAKNRLAVRLDDPLFEERPFLELEVVEFLQRHHERVAAASRVFKQLTDASAHAAAIWRDLSILTPDVRAALVRHIASEQERRRIIVTIKGDTALIQGIPDAADRGIERIAGQAVREQLRNLRSLYPKPARGWQVTFLGRRASRPRLQKLDEGAILVYLVDPRLEPTLDDFGERLSSLFVLYGPKERQKFENDLARGRNSGIVVVIRDSRGSTLAEFSDFRVDRLLVLCIEPHGRAHDHDADLFAIAAPVISLRRSTNISKALPIASLAGDISMIAELEMSENRKRTWPLPDRSVFFRARGSGPHPTTDALCEAFGRVHRLGLGGEAGAEIIFDGEYAGSHLPPSDVGSALFPKAKFQTFRRRMPPPTKTWGGPEVGVLIPLSEAREPRVFDKLARHYRHVVERLLAMQGWEILESGRSSRSGLHARGDRTSLTIDAGPDNGDWAIWRRDLFDVVWVNRMRFSQVERIVVAEDWTLSEINSLLTNGATLAISVRELAALPSSGSIWSLVAAQLRRIAGGVPTAVRTEYLAALLRDTLASEPRGFDAEPIADYLQIPELGISVHLSCSVRWRDGMAWASIRPAWLPPDYRDMFPRRPETPDGFPSWRATIILRPDGPHLAKVQLRAR